MKLPRPFDTEVLARSALAYAARGWWVLPLWWPTASGGCACGVRACESAGKHPIHVLVPRGLHDATTRIDVIRGWWQVVPRANVGVRTGAESGLVVLDVDGAAGRRALHALVEDHLPFPARWARTGGDGWHAYFANPGASVPNSSGRLGRGLDVPGDGGYIVVPSSLHRTGRPYGWIGHQHPELAPLPGWLLELVRSPDRTDCERRATLQPIHITAYASAALEREAGEAAAARAGQRNDRLNRAAFKLGQLVGAGVLDAAAATAALVAAGLAAGPGEHKIRSTVRRGLHAGMRHPRWFLPDDPC